MNEVVLYLEASLLFHSVYVALHLFSLQNTRRSLLWAAARLRRVGHNQPKQIVKAVERARKRSFLEGTCLPVALTAEAMLLQSGFDSELCIGAKQASGVFEAHAWLEHDGVVVVGGPKEVTLQYSRFPSIPVNI